MIFALVLGSERSARTHLARAVPGDFPSHEATRVQRHSALCKVLPPRVYPVPGSFTHFYSYYLTIETGQVLESRFAELGLSFVNLDDTRRRSVISEKRDAHECEFGGEKKLLGNTPDEWFIFKLFFVFLLRFLMFSFRKSAQTMEKYEQRKKNVCHMSIVLHQVLWLNLTTRHMLEYTTFVDNNHR
jgi:hypothetical protein